MAFTAIAAVAGLATAAYGAKKQSDSIKDANKAAKKANQQQTLVQEQTVLASEASKRAEALREKQMELEGLRRRRDIIRMAQGARALSAARATAQGVGTGDSARQGGQQQLANQARVDTLANLQNIMIGRGIFEENRAITDAQTAGAQFQSNANIFASQQQTALNQANYGGQLIGFGLNVVQAAPTFSNVATTSIFGNSNPQPTRTVNWANI